MIFFLSTPWRGADTFKAPRPLRISQHACGHTCAPRRDADRSLAHTKETQTSTRFGQNSLLLVCKKRSVMHNKACDSYSVINKARCTLTGRNYLCEHFSAFSALKRVLRNKGNAYYGHFYPRKRPFLFYRFRKPIFSCSWGVSHSTL